MSFFVGESFANSTELSPYKILDEFLANYEKLDDDVKLEIPLKRIWVINNTEE